MLFLQKQRQFRLDMLLCILSTVSHHLGARSGIVAFTRAPMTTSRGNCVANAKFSIRAESTTTATTSRTENDDHDYNELPIDFPRRTDVLVGLEAVRKACKVTNQLQPESYNDITTVNKFDLSPVTVADFAAQAVTLYELQCAFDSSSHRDSYIAEESRQPLDEDENLAQQVWKATGMESIELVKQSIQLGKEYEQWGSQTARPTRVWCLDPIDGTKGFLRGRKQGGQYAVALALLEDGVPTIGILGCPNLPSDPNDTNFSWRQDETMENNQNSRGCIFVASKDGGCYQLPFMPSQESGHSETPVGILIRATPNDGAAMTPQDGRFCIAVEKFSDALGQCPRVAKVLHGPQGLNEKGDIIKARKIDSQAKYGVLARAGAEYYARFTEEGYREWIWDHAAGKVVIEEAGGKMTDLNGSPIDFSLGPKMSDDVKGVLASNGGVFHDALVEAFHIQEQDRLQEGKM